MEYDGLFSVCLGDASDASPGGRNLVLSGSPEDCKMENYMEEMVPVVDENNRIVQVVPRSVMRRNEMPHRASYIVLGDGEGRFYIERRTMIKDYCPGMLDACVGGVVQDGEDDIALSAERELQEELGVRTELKSLGWKKLQHKPETFTWAGVFYGEYRGSIVMQQSEVDDVLMLTAEEVYARAGEFTPDSLIAFRFVQEKLKSGSLNG